MPVYKIDSLIEKAWQMFSAKAYVHQYTKYANFEEENLLNAFIATEQIIKNYKSIWVIQSNFYLFITKIFLGSFKYCTGIEGRIFVNLQLKYFSRSLMSDALAISCEFSV